MSNKNIWIIYQHAILPSQFGGTRHYDMAMSLKDTKLNFVVICSSFSNYDKTEKQQYSASFYKIEQIADNLKFIWVKTPIYKTNGWRRILSAYIFAKRVKRLSRILEKPDLIIGSSPQLFSSYEGLNLARKLHIPFIFEVRDIWPQSLVDLGINRFNPLVIYFTYLEKRLMEQSNKVIAIMPLLKKYAANKFKMNLDNIVWISNGILDKYVGNFSPRKKSKKFEITYSGTIGLAQDTASIIKAAARLRKYSDIHFNFIGDGVEKCKMIELAHQLKLDNSVSFFDPIAKVDLMGKLKNSDSLVISLESPDVYQYGCQPNKLFDYLAAGRPIIISSSAKNNPIAQAKCGINLRSNSEKKLAEAILSIYSLPLKERNRMGKNAIKFVKSNYLMSQLSKKFFMTINELIK